MTKEPTEEPTNAQVLAAVNLLATRMDALAGSMVTGFAQVDAQFAKVFAEAARQREGLMAIKVDTGFIDQHMTDFQNWARAHSANPNAHERRAA